MVTNAWLIAVTANFIPLEVYNYLSYTTSASPNTTLGYVNWTQSSFDISVLIDSGSFPLLNAMKLKLHDQDDNAIQVNKTEGSVYYLPFVNYTCMAQYGCLNDVTLQYNAFTEKGWSEIIGTNDFAKAPKKANTNETCWSLLFNVENPNDPAVSPITKYGVCANTDVTCR